MRQIMGGEISPVMTAAILTGLRVKKETIGEIAAAASVMRELATKVSGAADNDHFVDIVGTGGDGCPHLQHLHRQPSSSPRRPAPRSPSTAGAASSSKSRQRRRARGAGRQSSSSTPEQVAECIAETGIGFMFAPNHHAAMKNVAPVRREMGVRTLFNILGPLTNPAGAPNTLMGVFHPDLVGILVRVMQRLGAEHVLVVHGQRQPGRDLPRRGTLVGELKDGEVREYEIHPEDFGLTMMSSAQPARGRRRRVEGRCCSACSTTSPAPPAKSSASTPAPRCTPPTWRTRIGDGIAQAREAIASGAARAKLDQFVQCTQRLAA